MTTMLTILIAYYNLVMWMSTKHRTDISMIFTCIANEHERMRGLTECTLRSKWPRQQRSLRHQRCHQCQPWRVRRSHGSGRTKASSRVETLPKTFLAFMRCSFLQRAQFRRPALLCMQSLGGEDENSTARRTVGWFEREEAYSIWSVTARVTELLFM